MTEKGQKNGKNSKKGIENNQNSIKVEEKPMEMKSLEEQKADLEKNNPELLAKTRSIARDGKKKDKPKTTKREVTIMDKRTDAEKILAKVCKDLKLASPGRLNAKSDSKSGLGPFQAIGKSGGVKVSVRSNDVIAYCPHSFLGYGRQHPGRWVHVSILNAQDPNLEKAFRKALTDKKSGSDWAKELKFAPRNIVGSTGMTAEARVAKLQADLVAAKKALTSVKKTRKSTVKISKAGKKAIAKVMAPTTVVA
uniref:Uncharacterized protein n=1 Tax=viral metagenome TaxID=1070528 RepID=A0A6M3JIB6_9ZZZZ